MHKGKYKIGCNIWLLNVKITLLLSYKYILIDKKNLGDFICFG